MIRCVIFDLDDTLCDYVGAKENAILKLSNVLKENNIDADAFWEIYREIEPPLYKQFINKEITKEDYRLRRYMDVFDALKVKGDFKELSVKLNHMYMESANKEIFLFNDVVPVLKELKKQEMMLVILTNGPADGQRDKIARFNFENTIDKIYYCEEIGFAKPNPRAYEFVLNDLELEKDEVIMVGDTIRDDYDGAVNFGMKAVLLDRKNKYSDFTGCRINKMEEIEKIVGENK